MAGERISREIQNYMDGRSLRAPAFVYDPQDGFTPSGDTQRVVDELRSLSGREFSIRPANSVDAINGRPIWGTGNGYVAHDSAGRKIGSQGVVDPFEASTFVVAHEGAHAALPSELQQDIIERGNRPDRWNPLDVPRDNGARLRYVHEFMAKPVLVEEAHAQGVAHGLMEKLGIPAEESKAWSKPTDYPMSYEQDGLMYYGANEIGPASPGEMKTAQQIMRNTLGLVDRAYRQGRQLVR
jgi:hypothetical protein